MPSPDTALVSTLLEASIQSLDISPAQFELAVRRYEDLAQWLVDRGIGDPDVYPQGSFRLGTVLRPTLDLGFDIDLVFLRYLAKTSTTQEELRAQAKELLLAYIAERGATNGNPTLEEKGRCWTLVYSDDSFHMDVLPVIPDPEGAADAILLSDRDLRDWQHSNPIGYADWFWSVMDDSVEARRTALAETLGRDVEQVPRWLVRTTLQRVVQLLKLHRDLFFANADHDGPPSILITTLAARSYGGDQDLYTAFRKVAMSLGNHIEIRGDQWWIPNPAHKEENFADKWNSNPDRKEQFDGWVSQVVNDAEGWDQPAGIHTATRALAGAFGEAPVQQGAVKVAASFAAATASGKLGVTSTGRVTTKTAVRPVRPHDFHGD